MAGSKRQSAHVYSAAATGVTATFGSTPIQNNELLAVITSDTIITTGPSGWTQIASFVGNQAFYVYRKTAGASESTAVAIVMSSASPTSMVIMEVAGVTGIPSVGTVTNLQSNSGQTSLVLSTVVPSTPAFIVGCVGLHNLAATTTAPSWTTVALTDSGDLATSGAAGATIPSTMVGSLDETIGGSYASTAHWTGGCTNSAGVIVYYPTGIAPFRYVAAGALAYSAANGTTVAPAYPAGTSSDDALVLVVGMKPGVANGGSCTTPAGWTSRASLIGAGGYGSTLGADTGNCNLWIFTKDTVLGTESGTLTVTVAEGGTNGVAWAQIMRFGGGSGTYSFAGVTGSDTSAGSVSAVMGSDPGIIVNDVIFGSMCIPTDVTTPAQFTAEAVTATGATFSGMFPISEPDSTTGNDIGGFNFAITCTAGPATSAPTVTATATGTTTNVRGPVALLRIRRIAAAAVNTGAGFLAIL